MLPDLLGPSIDIFVKASLLEHAVRMKFIKEMATPRASIHPDIQIGMERSATC